MPTRTTTIAMRNTTGTYESCHAQSVMSHPWRSEPGIVLLAPVTTVEQAAAAAAAGAGLIDAGDDGALVPAIRRAVGGVRVCGEHEDAILVRAAPAGIEAAVRAGWPVLADLEGLAGPEALADLERPADLGALAGPDGPAGLARIEAAAAVCVWLGASVLR